MAKKSFMNPALGKHMAAAGMGDEPEPMENLPEAANQTVTCPKCGASLSLEPAEESQAEHEALAVPAKGPTAPPSKSF